MYHITTNHQHHNLFNTMVGQEMKNILEIQDFVFRIDILTDIQSSQLISTPAPPVFPLMTDDCWPSFPPN